MRLSDIEYAPNAKVANDWQSALTNHLKVLDAICHEHGIKYCLAFGGLLGTVRHRGHIPWDNDVDILVTEENYLKLLHLQMNGELPDGYRFVDRNTEKSYPLLFGRFIDERTSCPLSTSSFNGGAHGLFVDVFILFPLPDDQAIQDKAVTKFLVWEQLLCYLKRRADNRTDDFIRDWNRVKQYEAKHGREEALALIEAEFRELLPSFEDAKLCFHGSGGKYNGFARFETEWFKSVIRMPFDGIELDAPSGYQQFLAQFYGESWRLFPEGLHFEPYSASSLNIPGPIVTADYMQLIDRGKADWAFRTYTDLQMEQMIANHVVCTADARVRGDLYGGMIEKTLDGADVKAFSSLESIAQMGAEEAADASARLASVFRYQESDAFSKWHTAIRFTPRVLTAALWARFLSDPAYWKVSRVISLQREDEARNSFDDSSANKALGECLRACSSLYRAIDEGDTDAIASCEGVLNEYCPKALHAQIAHAFRLLPSPNDCLQYLQSVPSAVGSSDYLSYCQGYALIAIGERGAGVELLSRIVASSNNGMLILHASESLIEQGVDVSELERLTAMGGDDEIIESSLPKLEWPKPSSFGLKGALATLRNRTAEYKEQSSKLSSLGSQMAEPKAYIDKCRAYRRLTSNRIAIWERMYPRRELVAKAVATGKPEKIRKVSRAYLNALYRVYDKDGLGLFIDEFSLEAVKPVLVHDRGEEFVEDFLSKIPDCHKVDVDIWLKQCGVKHPYFE